AQRKRKYQVSQAVKRVPIKAFIFDLLYLDGQSWLDRPLKDRRQQLEKLIGPQTGELVLTPQAIVKNVKDFNKKFSFWVKKGMEGVVCKKIDSHYRAGKRDFTWVKYKRAMESQLTDTVDCLLMGYYPGRGRRSDFGIGALLVGIWNPDKEVFQTVAKIGTGLTDQQWREIKAKADKIKSTDKPKSYQVPKSLIPSVWTNPEIVVEIEADEVSRSPLHSSGLALRFPRMKRFRDKKAIESTSLAELKEIYSMQNSQSSG
ncbi:MAG: DNA ligase, partial [Patescibacteria group bacterium]